MRIQPVCHSTLIKSQIIPVLNKIFIRFCTPLKNIFKPLYKFCNILIPSRAGPNNKMCGPCRSGNFGQGATFNVYCHTIFMRKYLPKYSKILSIWKNKMILSIWNKISLNLETCFETVTTRLIFSKLLLILLFSHKILIFFK